MPNPFGFNINGKYYSLNNISDLPQNVALDGSFVPDGNGNLYGLSQVPAQIEVVNGNSASLDQLLSSNYYDYGYGY